MAQRILNYEDWREEGVRRFGLDVMDWRFVCPVCGHVASIQEWTDVGIRSGAATKCIGLWIGAQREAVGGEGPGPCNYTGDDMPARDTVLVTMPNGSGHYLLDFEPKAVVNDGEE